MIVAGVDEVGRGPLAGPVVAAAVILPDDCSLPLCDSKKLSAKKRNELSVQIKQQSISWSIAQASVIEIDTNNILAASLLAMHRAVMSLQVKPDSVLVDGNVVIPNLPYSCECIIKGDTKVPEISAASILAKVYRDNLMLEMHSKYPEYSFDKHKGYPTKAHIQALEKHGALDIHRKSFGPVKRILGLV